MGRHRVATPLSDAHISSAMSCCWLQWCRTPKPMPYAVTDHRAVLFVYPMGCPGYRVSINEFDRKKFCCCCPPREPSSAAPAAVPPQLAGLLSSEEFEAIVDDIQEAVAATAPGCALCSFMAVPVLGWHLTMIPYIVCGSQVMLGDLQEDVVNKWRQKLNSKGIVISAGVTSQHDKNAMYIALEKESTGDSTWCTSAKLLP